MACLVQLHRGSGIVAKLIRWQQRSQYAHASIMVGGWVYEAVGDGGVRKVGPGTYEAEYRAGSIVTATVYLTEAQEAVLQAFLEAQLGKRYDFAAVARFVTRGNAANEATRRWFCSELVVAAFQHTLGLPLFANTEPWEVSPGLLARTPILNFRGYEST